MPESETQLDLNDINFVSDPQPVREQQPTPPMSPPNYLTPTNNPDNPEIILLDVDKQISVTSGVPTGEAGVNFKVIEIPNTPHVFMVQELTLFDRKNGKTTVLENIPIMLGHAIRTYSQAGEDGWSFMDGSDVVEATRLLDKYCEEKHLPKIEAVLACNARNENDERDVVFADFDYDRRIIQVMGEAVNIPANQARLYENGATKLRAEADYFVNLNRSPGE